MSRLGLSVTLSLMTFFALIYLYHGRVQAKLEQVLEDPEQWLPWLGGGLVTACGISWLRTMQTVRRSGIVWRDYAPLLAVYGMIAAILLGGSLLGSVGFNLIVMIHVMAWLVHVRQSLAASATPLSSERGIRKLWSWLRKTPGGFITLHLAAAGVVLTLMALRVHLWQRVGLVSEMFATSSFHYWTIMHITMAYWRR